MLPPTAPGGLPTPEKWDLQRHTSRAGPPAGASATREPEVGLGYAKEKHTGPCSEEGGTEKEGLAQGP